MHVMYNPDTTETYIRERLTWTGFCHLADARARNSEAQFYSVGLTDTLGHEFLMFGKTMGRIYYDIACDLLRLHPAGKIPLDYKGEYWFEGDILTYKLHPVTLADLTYGAEAIKHYRKPVTFYIIRLSDGLDRTPSSLLGV